MPHPCISSPNHSISAPSHFSSPLCYSSRTAKASLQPSHAIILYLVPIILLSFPEPLLQPIIMRSVQTCLHFKTSSRRTKCYTISICFSKRLLQFYFHSKTETSCLSSRYVVLGPALAVIYVYLYWKMCVWAPMYVSGADLPIRKR